jgi:alpha-glucosidase (family GH31 glycosyl hydrolase)
MASNNATKNINDGYLSITKRVAECVIMRLQDVIQHKMKRSSFENVLGKAAVAMYGINKDISMNEFGIMLDVAPDEEEKSMLEQNLQMSLSQKEIRLEDVITVRRIKNVKLANQVLMFRRKKYQEEEQRKANEAQKMNAEIQRQANMQQSNLKMRETKMMAEIEQAKIQMEASAELGRLEAEYKLKNQLEDLNHQRRMKEIALNNSGKKAVADVSGKIKLDSIDRSAYNQSRLVEQKRDRALPLTELEPDPVSPPEMTEQNPIPNILR